MHEIQTANTTDISKEEEVKIRGLERPDILKIKLSFFPSEDDYSYWTIYKQVKGQRTMKLPVLVAVRKYLEVKQQITAQENALLGA